MKHALMACLVLVATSTAFAEADALVTIKIDSPALRAALNDQDYEGENFQVKFATSGQATLNYLSPAGSRDDLYPGNRYGKSYDLVVFQGESSAPVRAIHAILDRNPNTLRYTSKNSYGTYHWKKLIQSGLEVACQFEDQCYITGTVSSYEK